VALNNKHCRKVICTDRSEAEGAHQQIKSGYDKWKRIYNFINVLRRCLDIASDGVHVTSCSSLYTRTKAYYTASWLEEADRSLCRDGTVHVNDTGDRVKAIYSLLYTECVPVFYKIDCRAVPARITLVNPQELV